MPALKRCPHPHKSHNTICSRANPRQCTFLASCDPCSLYMVFYGLGQTQFHRKQTLEEILRPWCRSVVSLARSHPIMCSNLPYYHETSILHPPWFLMKVYLTQREEFAGNLWEKRAVAKGSGNAPGMWEHEIRVS